MTPAERFDQMVNELADGAVVTFDAAVNDEGQSPREAMREIVRGLLEAYVKNFAQ